MHSSDDEILRRVQRGERGEFLELFERHYPRIERYALRQLQNAEAANDIASETFLRAFRSVDSFRVGEPMSYIGYLFLVCRRLIITERQRMRTTQALSLETLEHENDFSEEQLVHAEPLPLVHLLDREKRDMVQAALQRLSAEDREIIQLAFESDLSRRDIANILGKPSISAVTSHLHRAMQKLRLVVAQQGYFPLTSEPERKLR